MSKHTKGPWRTEGNGMVQDELGRVVCRLAIPEDDFLFNQMQADARLIAAAPEMLEVLEKIVALPGFEKSEPYGVAVLAVIAKAKGE